MSLIQKEDWKAILESDQVINQLFAANYSEINSLQSRVLESMNPDPSKIWFMQLKMEQVAGRVFEGWVEGSIAFAPTYKYAANSDQYSAFIEDKSGHKRRSPAWLVYLYTIESFSAPRFSINYC